MRWGPSHFLLVCRLFKRALPQQLVAIARLDVRGRLEGWCSGIYPVFQLVSGSYGSAKISRQIRTQMDILGLQNCRMLSVCSISFSDRLLDHDCDLGWIWSHGCGKNQRRYRLYDRMATTQEPDSDPRHPPRRPVNFLRSLHPLFLVTQSQHGLRVGFWLCSLFDYNSSCLPNSRIAAFGCRKGQH